MTPISYQPIGVLHGTNSRPYGAPRQGVLAGEVRAEIRLQRPVTPDCLEDLVGFDRIWVVYDFHQNTTWKPKVMPPRGSTVKRSVFATRSPYRPNSIGISCVRLDRIDGMVLHISEHDILDGTPILDVKPYLAYADSFPQAKLGWIEEEQEFGITLTSVAQRKVAWLEAETGYPYLETLKTQLRVRPTCRKSKRVKKMGETYLYSLQTWRAPFDVKDGQVLILDFYSGYSAEDLESDEDKWGDKQVHMRFNAFWNKPTA